MSHGVIELVGEDVLCSVAGGNVEARLPYAGAEARLSDWAARYDKAAGRDDDAALAKIGREMFAWLDEAAGWASAWADGAGDRELEIRARRRDDPREAVLLDAPWELLARHDKPLALDAVQLFIVTRRIGEPAAAAWEPRHHDLQLMFMAAAPDGQVDLDYEREEASVLEATRTDQRVHVVVEETGTLDFLAGRLASDEGPFEAVHLSCHGEIDKTKGPVLLLETAEGGADLAGPAAVMGALRAAMPPLVVLSACRTAESGRAAGMAGGTDRRDAVTQTEMDERREAMRRAGDAGAEIANSFVRQLTAQVAVVHGSAMSSRKTL